MNTGQGNRPYYSPKRELAALETRRRILTEAKELFLRQGYAGTSVAAVARTAGVAERTVYLVFPTKAALLNEVIVDAVRADDSEAPLREQFAAALEAPAAELIRRFAAANAAVMARTARVMAIGEGAAAGDPQLAQLRERGHAALRVDCHRIAEALAARDALAHDLSVEDATDTMYALLNESVFLRLVDGREWSVERYQAWLERLLVATLLR